jgi:hypothetical protein
METRNPISIKENPNMKMIGKTRLIFMVKRSDFGCCWLLPESHMVNCVRNNTVDQQGGAKIPRNMNLKLL